MLAFDKLRKELRKQLGLVDEIGLDASEKEERGTKNGRRQAKLLNKGRHIRLVLYNEILMTISLFKDFKILISSCEKNKN